MPLVSPSILVITQNVNRLNLPTKSHSITGWIKKKFSAICCLLETHFNFKNTQLKRKGIEDSMQWETQKAGIAILTSGKINSMTKMVKRQRRSSYREELHFIKKM